MIIIVFYSDFLSEFSKLGGWLLKTICILTEIGYDHLTMLTMLTMLTCWQDAFLLNPSAFIHHRYVLDACTIGRVENCKSSQNQMAQCFFNSYYIYIGTEGFFFIWKKNIFDRWKWTQNLGFGHFQRFWHFFLEWQKIKFILTIPLMSIVIWNLHTKSFPLVPWCLKKNNI